MGWSLSKRMGLSISTLWGDGTGSQESAGRQALGWSEALVTVSLGPHACWSWALGQADMVEGPSLQGRKMGL